jgi:predicted CXXCH cytochrome family protein
MTQLTRRSLLGVAALAFAAVAFDGQPAVAQGTVVGSKHDLRAVGGGTATGTGLTEVCVVCHTPHQAVGATKQYPLWNHTGTATTNFGVYTSPTLNSVPANIGGATMGSQSASMLCMSCHDGTVSVLSMYNPPNAATPTVTSIAERISATGQSISNARVGTDMSDDHPVNFTYDTALATADGDLRDPATNPTVANMLIGGRMQCSSCHSTHDPTNSPFLRTSNVGSALCLACHIK